MTGNNTLTNPNALETAVQQLQPSFTEPMEIIAEVANTMQKLSAHWEYDAEQKEIFLEHFFKQICAERNLNETQAKMLQGLIYFAYKFVNSFSPEQNTCLGDDSCDFDCLDILTNIEVPDLLLYSDERIDVDADAENPVLVSADDALSNPTADAFLQEQLSLHQEMVDNHQQQVDELQQLLH